MGPPLIRTADMEIQPVNLTELAGVVMGTLIVLIPIMGATARFAAKPLVDALLQSGLLGNRAPTSDVELGRLSRRVLELEQELKTPAVSDPRAVESRPGELRRLRT